MEIFEQKLEQFQKEGFNLTGTGNVLMLTPKELCLAILILKKK